MGSTVGYYSITSQGLEVELGWSLTLVHHGMPEHLGKRIALRPGLPVVLGRGQDQYGAGVLDEERISRNHVKLEVTEQGVLSVVDQRSRNGTYVNGKRTERATLDDGDVIALGGLLLLAHRTPTLFRVRNHDRFLGAGYRHAALVEAIEKVCERDTTVLLCGETGTGKDLIAACVHAASGRTGKFVTVDCGAMPEDVVQAELFGYEAGAWAGANETHAGLLEEADGGTLYLDGIDAAPDALQRSLLRFLDGGEVRRLGATTALEIDARVIASSRSNPDELAASQAMREEFIARLSHWVVDIPPLRERLEDVPVLARAFAERHGGAGTTLHHKLVRRLMRYDWPGNARELEAVVERALIEGGERRPVPLRRSIEILLGSALDDSGVEDPQPMWARTGTLVVSRGWFQVGHGERVSLESRRSLWLMFEALLEARKRDAGASMTVPELLAAGWPDERVIEHAGANRVYVALTTLRKLGLRDVIVRGATGYMIDPGVPLQIIDW